MSLLVESLTRSGYLHNDLLIEAFEHVGRAEFLPDCFEDEAQADIPLPIGHGQMSPQPSTVAVMLEVLDPRPGDRILHIGSGTGWTAGLLAYVVGDEGKVVAFEALEEISRECRQNLDKFEFVKSSRVECLVGEGKNGYSADAPYDRVLVAASAEEIPPALREQLKLGGKMVIPIHNKLSYFEKRSESDLYREEFPGFVFMPLVLKSF